MAPCVLPGCATREAQQKLLIAFRTWNDYADRFAKEVVAGTVPPDQLPIRLREVARLQQLFDNQMAALFKRIRATPDDADAHRRLALMLASCPVSRLRDGKKAVEMATRACELTSWKDSMALDSLASAHAAAGDRTEAAQYERKAVEAEKDPAVKEAYRTRLKQYQSPPDQKAKAGL